MRVFVYVDGFNVYYRALKHSRNKWWNPLVLARDLLDEGDVVECVRYFTARVSARAGDPEAPARQQTYLKALASVPEIKIHYGRFLTKTKWRPLVSDPNNFVEVHDTEEKGSDVNLASYLLHDAWRDRYDAALVMSQDSDLCEPIRMVRDDLHKVVGIAWLDGTQPTKRFKNVSSFVRQVTQARLASSQFQNPLMGRDGHLIHKPLGW